MPEFLTTHMRKIPSLVLMVMLSLASALRSAGAEPPAPAAQSVGDPPALGHGWADYNRGLQHLAAFELPKAAEAFAVASQRTPKATDYATAHSLALLLQQKFAEGRAVVSRALASGPQTRMALAIRAFAAGLERD